MKLFRIMTYGPQLSEFVDAAWSDIAVCEAEAAALATEDTQTKVEMMDGEVITDGIIKRPGKEDWNGPRCVIDRMVLPLDPAETEEEIAERAKGKLSDKEAEAYMKIYGKA